MASGHLNIDLAAVAANWRALDRASAGTVETGAVVKADCYGLGLDRVAPVLAAAGARRFFVATAAEGAQARQVLGPGPWVGIFSGHMDGDTDLIAQADLTPMLNSADQFARHRAALPGHGFGIQLDSGMNRLGLEPDDWAALAPEALAAGPALVMSHLACADAPEHPQNRAQLAAFRAMTAGVKAPLSLSATGGIGLGGDFHFDLTRPGVGLYGGAPFDAATPVVTLDLPVIQVRALSAGETVGYGATWTAPGPARIATVSGGYADGLFRALGPKARFFHENTPCPLAGRVSMDLISVNITHLDTDPDRLTLLGPQQGIDALADDAGTIGYEILTALGPRYRRSYANGPAQ